MHIRMGIDSAPIGGSIGGGKPKHTCPRCDSLMLTPSHDGEPMYCIVCGEQGDTPPTNNVHGSKGSKARGSTIHTARYKATYGYNITKELQRLTVRYRLTYADQQGGNGMPALIMACPWCGGVTESKTWVRHLGRLQHDEWYMYVECPVKHSYSMVCNSVGEYYWR